MNSTTKNDLIKPISYTKKILENADDIETLEEIEKEAQDLIIEFEKRPEDNVDDESNPDGGGKISDYVAVIVFLVILIIISFIWVAVSVSSYVNL